MTPASPLEGCQAAALRFIAHKFCYRPLFCLEVRIAGGGIWAADKTVQCHQWSLNLPQSRRDGQGLATYQEASYKPFIIAAMIFMARIKDPVAALKKLTAGSAKS